MWSTRFKSNFSLICQLSLNHVKLFGCCHSQPFNFWSHKSVFQNLPSLHFWPVNVQCPHQHHHLHDQPLFSGEFHWADRKLHFMDNTKPTFCHSNLPSIQIPSQMLKNTSEFLACQYCHLLVTYYIGGITFLSVL